MNELLFERLKPSQETLDDGKIELPEGGAQAVVGVSGAMRFHPGRRQHAIRVRKDEDLTRSRFHGDIQSLILR